MKIYLPTLMVCACLLLACNKQKDATLTKDITFNIFNSVANLPPATDTSWVTVHLRTAVTNDSGYHFTRQWDTTLQRRQWRQFPDSTRPLQVLKRVDGVVVDHEIVFYIAEIVWERDGHSYFTLNQGYLLNPGNESPTIPIKIQ